MTGILLLGRSGQVGHALKESLAPSDEVIALTSQQMDLADPDQIRKRVRELQPQIIINAAAYTAVDKAEEEQDLAQAVNGVAPGILAEEAKRLGAAIIHYSTDYVFDGSKETPYTEDDAPRPLNVYGQSKLAGDRAIMAVGVPHLIFRTSWVYGRRGRNFYLTMRRLLKERDELRIVGDQLGAPTWSDLIARATVNILRQGGEQPAAYIAEHAGLYNLTCAGVTSWYGFACAIRDGMLEEGNSLAEIHVIPSSEYPTPAMRPAYSVLDNSRIEQTFGVALPKWDSALAEVMSLPPG